MKYSVLQVFASGKKLVIAKFLTHDDAQIFVDAVYSKNTRCVYEITKAGFDLRGW